MSWPAPRLMAGVLALLALLLAAEWLLPDAPPPLVSPARVRAAAAAPDLPARETAEWASAILARPVFSISRRPPKVAPGGHAPVAGESRLAGIMITPAGRRAIFAPEGGGHALVLGEGASVNGSAIRRIEADRVLLASGTALRPAYDRNRPTPPPYQPPFQPLPSAFQPPGGPPAFTPPPFPAQPGPNFQMLSTPQAGGEDSPAQPTPPPVFRGAVIPPRKEY